jgi:hypothetical protein
MREEALDIFKEESTTQSLRAAKQLYGSEKYQVRMVGVFVLGLIASESREALKFLEVR